MARFFDMELPDNPEIAENVDDFTEYVEITRDIAAIINTYRKPEQRRIIARLLSRPVSDQIKRDTLQAYEAQWLAGRRIPDEWAEAIYRNRSFYNGYFWSSV